MRDLHGVNCLLRIEEERHVHIQNLRYLIVNIRLMNEGRCDERLKVRVERNLHDSHTLGCTTKQTGNT